MVPVETGELAWIDDGPRGVGSEAPTVHWEAVRAALDRAYDDWHNLRAAAVDRAATVRTGWAFEHKLTPFVEYVKELQR
jgi:flavin-binding protein dodecin